MVKTREALIKFDSNQCFHIFSRFLAENYEKRIIR